MGFLNRRRTQGGVAVVRLPPDFGRTLELYGRWEINPQGAGIDISQIGGGNLQYEMWQISQIDKEAFVRAVAQVALSTGGWALYGGERLVMNQVDTYPTLTEPDYLALLDATTDFLIAQGGGPGWMPPYYMTRLADTGRLGRLRERVTDEPEPAPEPEIAPLEEGEERLLQTVYRTDGNRNDIYLLHRRPDDENVTGSGEPSNFIAIIRSTDQDPADMRPLWAWQMGPTERSIYIRIAVASVNAPPLPGVQMWLHPDVQWFADRVH